MAERTVKGHWPIMLLGGVVVIIFAVVLFTFKVEESEYAVVIRFGRPLTVSGSDKIKVYEPGLHFKWPQPVDRVWRHDNRVQAYELERGQYEQGQTTDGYQVAVQTYVLWRVGKAATFLRGVETTSAAEEEIDDIVRSARSTVLGQHPLTDLINTEASKVKIKEMEQRIEERANKVALSKYGIEIVDIGFKHIGFPGEVSKAVFERMRAERKRKSQEFIAEGKREARQIKAEADRKAKQVISRAEAKATGIRAKADRKAAEYYKVFREKPKLAAFLKKLDALKETLSDKSTLVLDTKTPPYDLFEPGAIDLLKKGTEAKSKVDLPDSPEAGKGSRDPTGESDSK